MIKFETKCTTNKSLNERAIIKKYQNTINKIDNKINTNKAVGVNMTGWLHMDTYYHQNELKDIINKAKEWNEMKIKNILVIGIGGSYIGIKAAIDMVLNDLTKINMIYVHNINTSYINAILRKLGNQKFGIIIISKSGTTLEPAVSFRIFRKRLEEIVSVNKAKKLIVAITDAHKGTLHDFASAKGYKMFYIPSNIGGRYSTLTPVGLFPMAVAGIDICKIMQGCKQALNDLKTSKLIQNSAYLYACYRHYLHTNKKMQLENFIVYDPYLLMIGSQWQQLFGESEGKNKHGLYPTYSLFTTDLHSLGQYLQDGSRNFFETTLFIDSYVNDIKLKINDSDDGIKYLNNKTLSSITQNAFMGTLNAHIKNGNVNNFIIHISKSNSAFDYGYLFIWLAKAAMMSSYLLKVNPFDQPGVEQYKKEMFTLLGKK